MSTDDENLVSFPPQKRAGTPGLAGPYPPEALRYVKTSEVGREHDVAVGTDLEIVIIAINRGAAAEELFLAMTCQHARELAKEMLRVTDGDNHSPSE